MAVFQIAQFEIRPEARTDAERAMFEYASYVRQELPGIIWSMYRDPQRQQHYFAVHRAETPDHEQRRRAAAGTQVFTAALEPLLAGAIAVTECELVTSSDLAPRFKRPPAAASGARRGSRPRGGRGRL